MKSQQFKKIAIAGGSLLAIFAMLVAALLLVGSNTTATGAGSKSGIVQGVSSPDCWAVKSEPVDANGRFRSAGLTGATAKEDAAQLLEVAQRDPVALASYYNAITPEGRATPLAVSQIAENGCYSTAGVAAYHALDAYVMGANLTPGGLVRGTITSGCNSFNTGNGGVRQECGQISGDTQALVIKGQDNKKHFVLRRCSNVVTPGPTPTPPGPTPPGPTPTPPATCPPKWPHGTPPICKDGPNRDPQSQGNVPSQFVKDHPSKDNASEVAQPPKKPTDSGNGLGGSPPRHNPGTAPSHSAPPSGPGPTHLPAPTSPPQPAGPAPNQPPNSGKIPAPPPPPA